ncbi:hypothetical protein HC956_05195 [Alcaligenes faecalis]
MVFMLVAAVSFECMRLFIWLFRTYPVESATEVAAWVQAVGSIGAIGIAIYLPYKQRKIDREIARREGTEFRLREMYALLIAIFETLRTLRSVCKKIRKSSEGADYLIDAERIRGLILSTSKFSPELMPERFMAFSFELRSMQYQALDVLRKSDAVAACLIKDEANSLRMKLEKLSGKARESYGIYKNNWNSVNGELWRFRHRSSPDKQAGGD